MVFLSELPRPRPLERRHRYAIAMAAVLAIATGFVVVFPRSAMVAGWLAVCGVLVLTSVDERTAPGTRPPRPQIHITLAFGALALWMLAANLWSPNPDSIRHTAYVASLLALLVMAAARIARVARHDILFIVESAWVVFIAAVVAVVIDMMTQQTWKAALVSQFGFTLDDAFTDRFVQHTAQGGPVLNNAILSRNGFAIALLVWPMLLTARSILSRRYRMAASLLLAAISVATVFVLPQDAAKVAMIAGAITFAVAWFFPRVALGVAIAVWVAVSLFAVPIAKIPHMLGVASETGMPYSFRERALIWTTIADAAAQKPIAGQGPSATATLAQQDLLSYRLDVPGATVPAGAAIESKRSPNHPHNGFLEVRFELGLIGSLLLALAGAMSLWALRRLPHDAMAYALATAAAGTTVLSTSFSLWSTSFAGALGFVILVTLFALRAHATQPAVS